MSDYLSGMKSPDNLPSFTKPVTWGGPGLVDFDFDALAKELDRTRDFSRVGIIYSNGISEWLVRPSRRIATPNQTTVSHVIVTKVNDISPQNAAKAVTKTLQTPSLTTEITSTAISCGALVATAFIAVSATLVIPFTAEATGIIAGIMTAGTVATSFQCAVGVGLLFAMGYGYEENVAWLDSQDWYTSTMTALDIISIAGASVALRSTIKAYMAMKTGSSAKALDWLRTLSRHERKRITIEIIRNRNPGISNDGIKVLIKAGAYPGRYPTEALQKSLQNELIKAFNNASAFAGSAVSGTIRNPQNLPKTGQFVIGLIQSFSLAGSRWIKDV
ncbi:hypothetical protein [Cronobacter muytjensii]|uniref:hypothetical protein n=1 Tax=Cronobacter muytjensii TaxID=413501 RepID=UPI00158807B1|nr:hypothetical protein [Cronobacter muytjensii]NUW58535.1 hypothetical protein [Cronobacter muytjensii]